PRLLVVAPSQYVPPQIVQDTVHVGLVRDEVLPTGRTQGTALLRRPPVGTQARWGILSRLRPPTVRRLPWGPATFSAFHSTRGNPRMESSEGVLGAWSEGHELRHLLQPPTAGDRTRRENEPLHRRADDGPPPGPPVGRRAGTRPQGLRAGEGPRPG